LLAGAGGEGKVLGRGVMLLAPKVKETAVAERDVLRRDDAQAGRCCINPLGRAFEFGKIADGGFVDVAVTLPVGPLRAPFFIAEGWLEADGVKNLSESRAVGDFGFGFDAVLMCIFAGAGVPPRRERPLAGDPGVGQALVGEQAAAGVVADAKDFSAGTQTAVGSVVKDVGFEGAGGVEGEAGGLEAVGEAVLIVDAEFDLCFDGHGK